MGPILKLLTQWVHLSMQESAAGDEAVVRAVRDASLRNSLNPSDQGYATTDVAPHPDPVPIRLSSDKRRYRRKDLR